MGPRLLRIPRFARTVLALMVGGVTIATAAGFWVHFFGFLGISIVAGVVLALLAAVIFLPDRAWERITTPPDLLARRRALVALSDHLRTASVMRRQFFEELPSGEEMWTATHEWYVAVTSDVRENVPEYCVDLEKDFSPDTSWKYENDDGVQFTYEQNKAVVTLDEYMSIAHEVLGELRRTLR